MKIKILNLYAVAYSAMLKHCPSGGMVTLPPPPDTTKAKWTEPELS